MLIIYQQYENEIHSITSLSHTYTEIFSINFSNFAILQAAHLTIGIKTGWIGGKKDFVAPTFPTYRGTAV